MGIIEDKHVALGGNRGSLGRARGQRIAVRGGELQRYTHGVICARRATGAVALHGPLSDKWWSLGGVDSSLGLPTSDQTRTRAGEDRARFDHGSLRSAEKPVPLTVYQQNTALLFQLFYKGPNRAAAIGRILQHLHDNKPDVVGLSEVFVDAERRRFKHAFAEIHGLSRLHRHALEGPDEPDAEEDGGLLLLSRHPFERTAQTIYRSAEGNDGLSNKGALHGRIRVEDVGVDLFLSHMQDPDAGGGAHAALRAQYKHLGAFVEAQRGSMRPALIMGDLNTRKSMRAQLLSALSGPQDLWETGGDGSDGITTDKASGFTQPRPLEAPERFQHGDRVDYFLSHRCDTYWPVYGPTRVEILQTAAGNDVSDHYGLSTVQTHLRGFVVQVDRPVKRVRASICGFSCLEATDEAGDDEVSFTLLMSDHLGRTRRMRTGIFGRVRTGQTRTLRDPNDAMLGPITKFISLSVAGFEHDGARRDDLGSVGLRVEIRELQSLIGRTRIYTLPVLDRDGGQYAVRVQVGVEG